jgi:DNA repair exonuclease SbcCD ATPase subunit
MRPTDKIPTWFRSTAIGRRLESEEQKEIAKGRKATAAELADVRKRLEQGLGPLREQVGRARENVNVKQRALDAAGVKLREALFEESTFRVNLEQRIHVLEGRLKNTADPRLDEFAQKISEQIAQTCQVGPTVEYSVEHELHSGRPVRVNSNRASILACLERLREIRDHKIPALRLEAGLDIEEEIARLRDSVPVIQSPGVPEPAAV